MSTGAVYIKNDEIPTSKENYGNYYVDSDVLYYKDEYGNVRDILDFSGNKNYIYTVGNTTFSGTGNQDVDKLDADLDSWGVKTLFPAPNKYAFGWMSFNGVGYITGGIIITGGATYYADHDEYVDDTWTARTNLPTPNRRIESNAFIFNDYLASHVGGNGNPYVNDHDLYNRAENAWTSLTSYPSKINYNMKFNYMDYNIQVSGLINTTGATYTNNTTLDRYFYNTSTFNDIGDFYTSTYITHGNVNRYAGKGYSFAYAPWGGSYTVDSSEYDIWNNTWTSKTDTTGQSPRFQTANDYKHYMYIIKDQTDYDLVQRYDTFLDSFATMSNHNDNVYPYGSSSLNI